MSNKKHIDRIFQEKFKDFEVSPNPELWTKIQNDLNIEKEEPKKVFPMWLRYASIAAILAILVTIGAFVFDGSSASTPIQQTVDTEGDKVETPVNSNQTPKNASKESNFNSDETNSSYVSAEGDNDSQNNEAQNKASTNLKTSENKANLGTQPSESAVASTKNNLKNSIKEESYTSDKKDRVAGINEDNQSKINTNQSVDSDNKKTINGIANQSYNNTVKNNPTVDSDNNAINSIENDTENSVANQSNKNNPQNSTNTTPNNKTVSSNPKIKSSVAQSDSDTNQSEGSNNKKTINGIANQSYNKTDKNNPAVDSENNAIDFIENDTENSVANQSNKNNPQNSNNTTLNNNTVSSNPEVKSSIAQSNSNTNLDKDVIENTLDTEKTQDAIALNAIKSDSPQNEKEKEETLKVGDSLVSESPSIEEAIAEVENSIENEEEKLVDRWQVQANIAPVYYNSLSKGSHIDDQFVSNSKSGEVNTSYGVSVSYALNKKLSVRSGINALKLSYDTDNVILYETPSGGNSNPVNQLRNINLAPGSPTLNAFSGENLGVQQISGVLFNAAISQRLGYYEVPVELEYKLINNRFGLNIIGGVSTLFLDENEVYSEFEEYTTYIGEANNVNNVSFSTNLGIGFNYKFTKALKFNLEPTFKYQLNGFENTSGNFRPYIIGVYTGFSYKF